MAELQSTIRRLSDDFAYAACYCPDFPAEDRETVDSVFQRLRAGLLGLKELASGESVHWLDLAISELDDSLLSYRDGRVEAGASRLDSARRYLSDFAARKPRRISPTFLVDAAGNTRKM